MKNKATVRNKHSFILTPEKDRDNPEICYYECRICRIGIHVEKGADPNGVLIGALISCSEELVKKVLDA